MTTVCHYPLLLFVITHDYSTMHVGGWQQLAIRDNNLTHEKKLLTTPSVSVYQPVILHVQSLPTTSTITLPTLKIFNLFYFLIINL